MSEPISYREEVKRKLIHLSSLWMPVAILLLPGRLTSTILFGILFFMTLAVERAYVLKVPVITPVYNFFFGKMLRKEPSPNAWIVSGGAPVYAAAALTCLFFVPLCAAAGMAVLMTADAAAALIGRKFGKHKLVNGKSLEGTLAFVLTGVLAAGVCISAVGVSSLLPYVLPAVILAALAELFQKQLKVDDNFSIPLVTAGFLQLALRFH
jgi:dolichol kinase